MILDTNALTTAAGDLDSLVGEIESMKSTVEGYDESTEDGFNFSGAKAAILANIAACAARVRNSATYITSAADAHTKLQNGMKFDSGGQNSGSSARTVSSGNTFNSSSGSSYVTATTPTSTKTTSSTVQKRETTDANKNEKTEEKPEFKKVGYATYNSGKLTDETKKITEHENFSYDEDGYAKLDGKYVITCDSSYGKIGDVLRFTTKNGEPIECVIGVATAGEEYKDTINFMIDENKADGFKPKDFSKNLIDNTEKIENTGSCIATTNDSRAGETSSETVRGAIDWALGVADDDSHGYSQATRYGNPNYDCSSLVISSWDAAGVPVKDAGATYTGDMREAFLSTGQFEWIPGDPDVNTLQPGDVLLSESSHTEMYIGNGNNVGAHYDSDGMDGDSSGGEISVSNYYSHPWDGVLRYTGSN